MELIEESLDYDLYGSKVRFHFQDMAVLGGVSVHESHGCVVVLVPTVASVHRLIFPHPNKLHRQVGTDRAIVLNRRITILCFN